VFYPRAAFDAAGYAVPSSWDELVALSHRIVADGGVPWCFGFESGDASGWPGTDLLESLVLRAGGVAAYDAWAAGELAFSSATVAEAGRLAEALIFEPGFVRGGPAAISRESYDEQLQHLLARDPVSGAIEPECWLYHQANFMLRMVPPDTRVGEDIDFFVLPPLDPGRPTPATGGALFASALVDRPEVRALIEFVASPDWGKVWATAPAPGFISANQRFDLSAYGDAVDDPAAAVRVALATATRAALAAGVWRYDASDLMPPAIGGWADAVGPGAFWRGMLAWVDGRQTLAQVLADIDAEWAALDG
jgi:alpha-glucoside transport system substrate-binding protein